MILDGWFRGILSGSLVTASTRKNSLWNLQTVEMLGKSTSRKASITETGAEVHVCWLGPRFHTFLSYTSPEGFQVNAAIFLQPVSPIGDPPVLQAPYPFDPPHPYHLLQGVVRPATTLFQIQI